MINLRSIFLLLLLSDVCCGASSAQTTAGSASASTVNENAGRAGIADEPRYMEIRTRGFQALYNLDYAEARRNFKELQKLYPDHPAGWQFLAATVWLETLNKSRRLQASLYNGESFYADSEDAADPTVVREFRELTKQASALSEARLKRNPKDIEALYFSGATAGLKAAFAGAVERKFIGALRAGSAAVDRHLECVKLDPNFHDAEVTVGLYDYIVGDLPLVVKVAASIGGIRGSKKRGLLTLERVVREGKYANDDARVLLIALYRRENRPADAARFARELSARYPRNHLFKLETADALIAEADLARSNKTIDVATIDVAPPELEREAFAIYESLLERVPKDANRPFDLIHFKYGEALLAALQEERAAQEFLRAATAPEAEPGLATMARLRAAQALDLAGRRADALREYKVVLARPAVYDAHKLAGRGLQEAYKK